MTSNIVHVKHFLVLNKIKILFIVFCSLLAIGGILVGIYISKLHKSSVALQNKNTVQQKQLQTISKELQDMKNQDQFKRNNLLQDEIKHIQDTYSQAVVLYEKLLDLKAQTNDTKGLDSLFAESLNLLSKQNYSSASADLKSLSDGISQQEAKLVVASVPVNAPTSNTAPGNGFSQQTVTTGNGSFVVDIIAADLNSTRVIVDTASDGDCSNNCPVLPLSDYVNRSGAYAGINGTFFCPPEYPSCAGKTNSFDTLLMNKNKHYFNSNNNVYSVVPLVYFTGNTMGVRGHSSDWGRDTGVDSVIAMQPILISGGNIAYTDSSDPKFKAKGNRSFIAAKGNTVYIGFIFNATMGEGAGVLKTLGMDNALNLDEGGSSALWSGGYQVGPGRNIPNAVLFVHK